MKRQTASERFTDPVCGMQVAADSAAGKSEQDGETYYFCSAHCQQKFEANPADFVKESQACCGSEPEPEEHSCCHGNHGDAKVKPSATANYFCPMCAGVESAHPGTCPKCGMAL